jgi:hypothetical protein
MPKITRLALPLLVTVTAWALLVVFTSWLPNEIADVEILIPGVELAGAGAELPPPHPKSDTTIMSAAREP